MGLVGFSNPVPCVVEAQPESNARLSNADIVTLIMAILVYLVHRPDARRTLWSELDLGAARPRQREDVEKTHSTGLAMSASLETIGTRISYALMIRLHLHHEL